MQSFLNKTLFNHFIDIKLSKSNLFSFKLKMKNKSKNLEQMVFSSCLNSKVLSSFRNKIKVPLYLKSFKCLESALTDITTSEDNSLVVFFYKDLIFTNNFKNLKLNLNFIQTFNKFNNFSNLLLISFMKKVIVYSANFKKI